MSLEKQLLKQIIEGALLAIGQPLSVEKLLSLFDDDDVKPSKDELQAALEDIQAGCEGRGFELNEVATGWRFQVRQEMAPWVNRLWEEKPQKYSRALLETLALIAYRQPITRGDIEQIRGVAVSSHIIKTLAEREWIKVVGHRDVPGRPSLYATTKQFLDYFNLKSLDQLPSLGEIKDLDELNKELDLGGDIPASAKLNASSLEVNSESSDEESDAPDGETVESGNDELSEHAISDQLPEQLDIAGDEPVSGPDSERAEQELGEPAFEEPGMDATELAKENIGENDPFDRDEDDEPSAFEKLIAGEAPIEALAVERDALGIDKAIAAGSEGSDENIKQEFDVDNSTEPQDELGQEPESDDGSSKHKGDSLFAPSTAASVFDETP